MKEKRACLQILVMSFATGMMAVGRREGGRPFQGLRVFLPRNYVPPEKYSALQDALTHQGAEVFLNLNPFSNSSIDYHVLADSQVDKIKDMQAKGCRVVGPECVFRCARDCKRLPDREYTCCLALQGVSVLLTGFTGDEKRELEELVTSMDGTLQQQTAPDVDFVVGKDVLATKYKWACGVVRKPVLMSSWLRQCAREHRQVPHEPHRMLPLAGLNICVTGIVLEDRFRIQEAAPQNGATYHAHLSKGCSHLIALEPDGPKFQAANAWGLKVVSQNWFWESIKHKMSLDETLFPVVAAPKVPDTRTLVSAPAKEDVVVAHEQGPSPSPASNTNDVSALREQQPQPQGADDVDAERRQSIGRDAMYLSGCRIFLTGFSASEMRKLVNLVLAGGGTRHMDMNDTITHVILGSLPESDMKEIRQLAMWGAVYILQPAWLEECTRQRREVSTDLYLISQSVLLQGNKEQQQQTGRTAAISQTGRVAGLVDPPFHDAMLGASGGDAAPGVTQSAKANCGSNSGLARPEGSGSERALIGALGLPGPAPRVNKCFAGHVFGFTNDYPAEQRAEVVRRVLDDGGLWEGNASSADYVLAPHGGFVPVDRAASTVKYVSKYWIAQCVEEGKLLDIQSHTLFRPLPCDIPISDFQGVKFCVSQYSERDRKLLRKLCRVLKVKFTEKFNSKITHLLCKVKAGEKYENAERLGIRCITVDWLYACAAQNKALPTELFPPREPTAAEKEVEHSFMTQRPIRAGQLPSHPFDLQTQASDQSNVPVPSQSMTFTSKGTASKPTSRPKIQARRHNNRSSSSSRAPLSSQAHSHLDPWDASAPSVAEAAAETSKSALKPSQESISLRPSTGSTRINGNSSKTTIPETTVPGASKAMDPDPSEVDIVGEPNVVDNAMDISIMDNDNEDNDNDDNNKDGGEEGTANVVDAIEGLLRQTSKVKGGIDTVEPMEVHISPEAATLSRRTREETHTHVDFKKPKLYPTTRSSKAEGESKSPNLPIQEDSLRFDESQLDSQMVAYDEDHSERQNLMERVRTRSSSVALASNNSVGVRQSDKPAAAWKGDQKLGRLFKAAEANK